MQPMYRVLTESVIDAMSIMSILKGQGKDYKQYDYLPLSGTDKHESLLTLLDKTPKKEVLLALDHDNAGVKRMQQIHDTLIEKYQMQDEQITYHVAEKKDWNEDLTGIVHKFQSLKKLPFLEKEILPEIKPCAIQNTEQYRENGFFAPKGMVRYRLVGLSEDGNIIPVETSIPKNLIVTDPKKVREAIPNMYEEVSYKTLLEISSIEGQDDYDITLIGNDFTIYGKEDYEEGKVKYLSTTYHLFRDPYFRTLKPKQKLLVMDLLNIQMAGRPNGVNTYRIYRKNFIKKYANIKQNDEIETRGLLNITVRTLQKYFKLLKHYFSICLKNGMYFFTLKTEFARSEVRHTTENHITMQHLVKAACRRNKIKDPDVKEQEKIEKVLENREKEVLNRFVNISDVIRSMIETINEKIPDPRKWSRRLKATLFIKKFNEAVS